MLVRYNYINNNMGCHTWCYKKINRSFEEAKLIALERITISIHEWANMPEEDLIELREMYEPDRFIVKNIISHRRLLIKRILNNKREKYVWDWQPEMIHNTKHGNYYGDNNSLPYDIFRAWTYPTNQFFSFEEIETWIKKNEEVRCEKLTPEQWEYLRKFWIEYPDGMMKFG